MSRLLVLAILIGALYAAYAFLFGGHYATALWASFKGQVEVVSTAAQTAVGMLHP